MASNIRVCTEASEIIVLVTRPRQHDVDPRAGGIDGERGIALCGRPGMNGIEKDDSHCIAAAVSG